jgi:hypothetical protein
MNFLIENIPASLVAKLVYVGFAVGFAMLLLAVLVACTAFALWLKDRLRE